MAATNDNGIIGGQPVVRPDGTVIVPTANANETAIGAFNSTNGGVSWSAITTIATIRHHTVAGSLREGPLPSAEIDGAGTVYVAWTDCRFRRACKANDIVIAHSLNATGTSWSAVTRVPIDATNSGIDHFIPGLAVNKATSGAAAQLGLTYYFYPKGSTQLSVGFTSSANAGSTWSTPQTIASGMTSTWAATTSQGRMVGDYISTSYGSDNLAHGIFGAANAPTTGAARAARARSTTVSPRSTPSRSGLACGSLSSANDPVLFSGNGGADAQSLLEHRGQQRDQAPRLSRRWPGAPAGTIGEAGRTEVGVAITAPTSRMWPAGGFGATSRPHLTYRKRRKRPSRRSCGTPPRSLHLTHAHIGI